MPTKTATPTVEELQREITRLHNKNEAAEADKNRLSDQLDEVLEREKEAQEADERRNERARQVIVDHHDEQQHVGSQRFCTTAPCPALNQLLDGGDL